MENFMQSKLFGFLKKGLLYVVVVYIFVILGRSIWLNWALKKEVDQTQQEIVSLNAQNRDLENLIIYYQSDSFKELEARGKLGLQKPGETVVLVPVRKFNDYQTETENDRKALSGNSDNDKIPNWQAWWIYIFG